MLELDLSGLRLEVPFASCEKGDASRELLVGDRYVADLLSCMLELGYIVQRHRGERTRLGPEHVVPVGRRVFAVAQSISASCRVPAMLVALVFRHVFL